MKKISLFILIAAAIISTSIVLYPHLNVSYDFPHTIVNKKELPKKVLIIPLNKGVKKHYLDSAVSYLTHHFPDIEVSIADPVKIPKSCHNGRRYRADSVLNFLDKIKPDSVYRVIAVTSDDISITRKLEENGKIVTYPDRGIIGYGRKPGSVCVASNYRISKNIYSFAKVVTHEFMHTLGVSHCNHDKCIMQDGKGSGKPLRESTHIHEICLKKANIGLSGNSKKLLVLNMKLK